MRPKTLVETLKSLIGINRAVLITGAPGGGKTTVVRQVASDLGLQYIEKHLPTMLVEDFGIPYPNHETNTLSYRIPDWFPAKGGKWDNGKGGVLCFDDRNQGDNSLQKVLANIIQARTLHGVPMADGWSVVSTGNRQSDRSGANRVLAHLANRETMIPFETHLDDWSRWATDNGIDHRVHSFLRYRPNLLHDFDPQRDQNPTPRSWAEGVAALMPVVSPEAQYEVFTGAVGEGAASEFVGFLRVFAELPDLREIFAAPDTAPIPDNLAALYALSGALANAASTEPRFAALVRYFARVEQREFSVLAVSHACAQHPDMQDTPAYVDWAIKHQNVLF